MSIHSVEESDGIRFLTMQLVEGETLSKVISEGDLSVERILDIVIDLTDALASAHEKGIIHRDLKPGNIMLRSNDSIALIDFGLAKRMRLRMELTDEGEIFGTPYYMSPEQGHGNGVDHRSDIYSLGVIFLEMLSG